MGGVVSLTAWRRHINLFLEALTLTLGALLPIINPFSTAPLFVSLSAGFDEKRRNRQALLACIYAFFLLVTFLLVGSAIIEFFGISVPGIRVAGGLIISTIGFRMLFPSQPTAPDAQAAPNTADIAFTPICMPSLAGPGSITVVLSAAGHIRSYHPNQWDEIYAGVILGLAMTLVLSFLVLRGAGAMVRYMGPGGLDAMTRIFGFLLICIGMQFLLTGVSDFYGLKHV